MKVVLAYSGGLDTSVILCWLQENYNAEVVVFMANLGQEAELEAARERALSLGVKAENIFIDDLRERFVKDFVFPMFRANALYEGQYLLGTSIARPLIAERQIEIANLTKADAVSHGATGKGNDQLRFELGYYSLSPNIKVIAPWREWDLNSRAKLLEYAKSKSILLSEKSHSYSIDSNLLHVSYEGGILEDPSISPDEEMWSLTVNPEGAPDTPEVVDLEFDCGDLVAVNGEKSSPHGLLKSLNEIGSRHGVGRLDMVENRFVGMKSRGCYETPGGTILLTAHRAIESITLDRELSHLKDDLMPRYSRLIYNGLWFSPERLALQALIDQSQQSVKGSVKLKLYKGGVIVISRNSPHSLFDKKISSFEDDEGTYDQKDATGFIKLNALRLRILARSREE